MFDIGFSVRSGGRRKKAMVEFEMLPERAGTNQIAPLGILSLRSVQGAPVKEIGGTSRRVAPEHSPFRWNDSMSGLHGERRPPALKSGQGG